MMSDSEAGAVNPAPGSNPQNVYVYVQQGVQRSDSEHYRNNYPSKLITGLAATQVSYMRNLKPQMNSTFSSLYIMAMAWRL